jgi:hypothetical protein
MQRYASRSRVDDTPRYVRDKCDVSKEDREEHDRAGEAFLSVNASPERSCFVQQIEQNLTFDFSLTAEDGSALKPVFGPGTTGLGNLGNRWDDW